MRTYKYIAFCLLSLWACTDGDEWINQVSSGEPLQVQARIEQQYVTRASDGGFATGDEIGVYIVNREGGQPQPFQVVGNHADNVRFTYDADKDTWTGSYQLYWKDKQTHADAYGYYPFDADLQSIEDYPFSIQRKQNEALTTGRHLSGYEASDFLWAKSEDIVPGTPINLRHHHLMASIQVKLAEGEGFEAGEWDRLEKSVLVENTALDTYINLANGIVGISRNTATASISPQQRDNVWRAVIAPQTVKADKSLIAITVDGDSYNFQRTEDMVYYSGKLHKFTIKVDKRLPEGDYKFTLLSESVTPWENDPESHKGSTREYLTIHLPSVHSSLEHAIDSLGIDPAKIINLKLTGVTGSEVIGYQWGDPNRPELSGVGNEVFDYIREHMPNIEALNMKELKLEWLYSNWQFDDKWYYGFIPDVAFEGLDNLSYFNFPDSLKRVGDAVFLGCSLKGSLIFPEGTEHVGEQILGWNRVQVLRGELYLPSTLKSFGSLGIDCYFTNELILPESMEYLGGGAFSRCKNMTGTIRIPHGLTELNNAWPDQIKGPVVIPQGIKKINSMPHGAVGNVRVPEGVEEIGAGAFGDCFYIRDVHLPSTLKLLRQDAFRNSNVTHVNLPEGIEFIEEYTFYDCHFLQDTITIPSTVIRIKDAAFQNCSMLNAVILPEGLEEIKDGAFAGCPNLDYMECKGKTPPVIHERTFSGVEKNNFTVVVPAEAVEAYKSAPYWSEFKRIAAYRNFVCRPMQAKLLNKGHVREVVLNADTDWSVASCPSWMHVSQTSGYKKTELQITIDDMPHNQGDREGDVVFQLARNDNEGHPITCTYHVKQFDYETDEDAVLRLQRATKGQRGGIDILFVGDGYDAEDIATGTFVEHMEQEAGYFFAVEPFKTYKDYFNVSVAMAMSLESGVVDKPDKWRNTKFSITYGAGDNYRLYVPFEDIVGYVLDEVKDCPVTEANFHRSLVVCVPNSDAYEGLTVLYGDGSAVAVCPHSTMAYPNDARGLIQHEACGHGWGKLGDEYVYHREHIRKCLCECCEHAEGIETMKMMGWCRNLSLSGKYKDCEWRHLVFDRRYSDIVDIYEGGYMHGKGVYRSEVNSCMNNNVPYFSTVSRQAMVERILWAAGEEFDFETFVSLDSREMGDKFITRGQSVGSEVTCIHSDHHGPVVRKGSPMDYIGNGRTRTNKEKKGGMR